MSRNQEKTEKNFTVLGEETEFYGELKFTDNLVIAGSFEGTIESSGDLEFAKTAVCKADTISANSIVIDGVVSGNMTVRDEIELHKGSKVVGDIAAARVRIEDGVDFSGQISMLADEPDIDIFSYPVNELKDVLLEQGKVLRDE